MKRFFKPTLAALVALTILTGSCKKNTPAINPDKTADNTDISKQIALDLYRSLSGKLNSADGLKVHATQSGTQKTNTSQECGISFTTVTNKTVASGDTSRTYTGISIFTNKCDGYFNDGFNVDAYTLADTLKTIEKGPGFNNNYGITLNYKVKALNSSYSKVSIVGVTSTSSYTSKVSGNVTSEYHKLETTYNLLNITAENGPKPRYVDGRVAFSTTTADKDAGTGVNGSTNAYSGYMEFLSNDTVKSYFDLKNGSYKVFLINLLTGEVTLVK